MAEETSKREREQIELPDPGAEAVRDALRRDGLSQAAAAAEMGVGASALNQWLGGRYRGDNAGVAAAAREWLDARERRASIRLQLPEIPAWVETPASKRILGALAYAHATGDMCCVIGPPGAGKTVAAERFASRLRTAWLVTASPVSRSVSACLRRVAGALGAEASSDLGALEAACAEKLRGARGILVVDEANCLATGAVEMLRSLHDAAGCGLALVGTSMLWSRLSGGGKGHPEQFAQLQSRVGRLVRLGPPSADEADAYCAGWGAGRVESSALEAARAIAAGPGGLRGLCKSLRLAFAYTKGEPVSAEALGWARRDLGGNS